MGMWEHLSLATAVPMFILLGEILLRSGNAEERFLKQRPFSEPTISLAKCVCPVSHTSEILRMFRLLGGCWFVIFLCFKNLSSVIRTEMSRKDLKGFVDMSIVVCGR